jgi:multisubunit Na+/H+ antiporter MnhG subunit
VRAKLIISEILSASLATFGSVILVVAFFPIINPSNYEVVHANDELGILRYLFGIIGSFGLFWFSSRFNKRAGELRKILPKKISNDQAKR